MEEVSITFETLKTRIKLKLTRRKPVNEEFEQVEITIHTHTHTHICSCMMILSNLFAMRLYFSMFS